MKPFFSILSVEPNSYSSENVVIGLIVVADKIYFDYSKSKLNFLNKFNHGKELTLQSENSLKKIFNLVQKENDNNHFKEFENTFSLEYFKYLNQYAAGSLVFSEPKLLNIEFNKDTFAKYYQLFVGEPLPIKKTKKVKSYNSKINELFIKQELDKKVDLNYNLSTKNISGILKDTSVSLITVNGHISCLQSFNWPANPNLIINNIYEAEIISKGLMLFGKEKGKGVEKMKIAIETPQGKDQKGLFDKMYAEKKDFFDFYEFDKVKEYANTIAKSNEYGKFSELIE